MMFHLILIFFLFLTCDFFTVISTASSDIRKPRYVRVNTLRKTTDEVIKVFRYEGCVLLPRPASYNEFLDLISNLSAEEFTRDFHVKDLLVFATGSEFHNHPLYADGTLLLQDKASCLPPMLLKPEPGKVVLDMCSAPGMKTTMLSALTRNKGTVYAVELNERRCFDLKKMVENAGCTNVTVIQHDAMNVNTEQYPWCDDVEYILLDPSCTGTGMGDRSHLFIRPLTPSNIRRLTAFQRRFLTHALTNFPSARRVVYSTCSLLQKENEEVVETVLSALPHSSKWKLVNAFPEWPSRGSADYKIGPMCVTARPSEDLTTGFFIAVFERDELDEKPIVKTEARLDEGGEEWLKKCEITIKQERTDDGYDEHVQTTTNEHTMRRTKKKNHDKERMVHIASDADEIQHIASIKQEKVEDVVSTSFDNVKSKSDKRKRRKEEFSSIKQEKIECGIIDSVNPKTADGNSDCMLINEDGSKLKRKKKKHREADTSEYFSAPTAPDECSVQVKTEPIEESTSDEALCPKIRRKRRNKNQCAIDTTVDEIMIKEEDIGAEICEEHPKPKKKKHRNKNQCAIETTVDEIMIKVEDIGVEICEEHPKPKKKKHRHRNITEMNSESIESKGRHAELDDSSAKLLGVKLEDSCIAEMHSIMGSKQKKRKGCCEGDTDGPYRIKEEKT